MTQSEYATKPEVHNTLKRFYLKIVKYSNGDGSETFEEKNQNSGFKNRTCNTVSLESYKRFIFTGRGGNRKRGFRYDLDLSEFFCFV